MEDSPSQGITYMSTDKLGRKTRIKEKMNTSEEQISSPQSKTKGSKLIGRKKKRDINLKELIK
jgi:hypothetical protein